MIKSFKSRTIMTFTLIVSMAIFFTIVFFAYNITFELTQINENHALQMIESVKVHIESEYNNISHHSDDTLVRRKIELKNHLDIAFAIIQGSYDSFQEGLISEAEAKLQVIESFKGLRYDNDIGYFWINDTTYPFPTMIMHPTIPDLDGQVLDDEEFYVVKDTNENLFTAFVDVINSDGQGYVEYLWPKPTLDGLTERQPKVSFVKLFRPWQWIIGTGLYIDDIESDIQERLDVTISDLNQLIPMYSIGDEGYYFIFDEDYNMLVHPNVSFDQGKTLRNPETGDLILDELIEISQNEDNYLDYLWNKPSDLENFIYRKRTYVTYFEPLGWYIASSYYPEEFMTEVKNIVVRLTFFASGFALLVVLISIGQMRSLFKPFYALVTSIRESNNRLEPIHFDGEYVEVELLKDTINNMIASLKENRDELVWARQNLQNLMDSATLVSIIATTPEGIITTFNTGAEAMLGYTAQELVGKKTPALFHHSSEVEAYGEILSKEYGYQIEGFEVFIKKAKESGYEEREWTYIKKDGSDIIVKLGVTTIRNDEGQITGFLGIASDITQMKNAEIQLKDQSKELSEAVAHLKQQEEMLEEMVKARTLELENSLIKLKSAQSMLVESEKMAALGTLVAGVAHEINTPVGVAITLASNLEDRAKLVKDKLDAGMITKKDLHLFLEITLDSSEMIYQNMERTANLVSSFKQVSADQHVEMKRSFNVCSYLNDVIRSMGKKLERSQIHLEIDCADYIELYSYPGALFQIITNLILNSEKHGFDGMDGGNIKISVSEAGNQMVLVYEDDGVGIPEDQLKRIFDPFYTTKRGEGGTGLGLNIVYNIVNRNLKGTILCESKHGAYTRFIIRVPIVKKNERKVSEP